MVLLWYYNGIIIEVSEEKEGWMKAILHTMKKINVYCLAI